MARPTRIRDYVPISGVVIALALAVTAVTIGASWYRRQKLIERPLELVHENDISDAIKMLVEELNTSESKARWAADQLRLMVAKSRKGWAGYIEDQYH